MSELLGPLTPLVGVWEGDQGHDRSPNPGLDGTVESHYRERMTFEETGLVENHSQSLYGLRYTTTAWRLGEPDPFHEELGYWLWDAEARQVFRCFMVPRGVTVLAGGSAEANASRFSLAADVGSETLGICSNPFLDRAFKTVRYTLDFEVRDANTIHYAEDTVLKMPAFDDLFHHTDENTLTRSR